MHVKKYYKVFQKIQKLCLLDYLIHAAWLVHQCLEVAFKFEILFQQIWNFKSDISFEKIGEGEAKLKRKPTDKVIKLVDDIMTLSLVEAADLCDLCQERLAEGPHFTNRAIPGWRIIFVPSKSFSIRKLYLFSCFQLCTKIVPSGVLAFKLNYKFNGYFQSFKLRFHSSHYN